LKKFQDNRIKANADFNEQKIKLKGSCESNDETSRGRGGTSPGIY